MHVQALSDQLQAHAPIQTLKRRSIRFMGDVTFTLAACGATSSSSRSRRSRTPVKSDVPPAPSMHVR